MISLIYVILETKKMSQRDNKKWRGKPRYRLLTIENKLMVTRGEVGARMGEIRDGD